MVRPRITMGKIRELPTVPNRINDTLNLIVLHQIYENSFYKPVFNKLKSYVQALKIIVEKKKERKKKKERNLVQHAISLKQNPRKKCRTESIEQ